VEGKVGKFHWRKGRKGKEGRKGKKGKGSRILARLVPCHAIP
jgi:hypothetical protein